MKIQQLMKLNEILHGIQRNIMSYHPEEDKLTSGWKKISGPRNRSYPTSTVNDFLVILFIPSYVLNHFAPSVSYFINSRKMSGQT